MELVSQGEIISVRQIMKDLRVLMAQDIEPEERLDRIVSFIAQKLHVDVCSCYIVRPGDILELCATYGLDKKAVHETFLRIGEGLIGEIALQRKTLAFADIWTHDSFVYKPETKEDPFKSLLGVPLVRSNKLLGVLAIQTKKNQSFSNDISDVLETIGMVLAEMLSKNLFRTKPAEDPSTINHLRFEGSGLIPGFAVGRAILHRQLEQPIGLIAEDSHKEIQKLMKALSKVEQEINKILATSHVAGEQSAIFETYLMFLKDKGWIGRMIKAIETGLAADTAVQKIGQEMTDRMKLMTDSYIRERIHDVQDLINRLIRHLRRGAATAKSPKIPRNSILIAKSLGPAELLDYDLKKIKGIVLEEGSQTMHMVIVTRSMNIPLICGIKNVEQLVNNNDLIALDATNGVLYVNPSDDTIEYLDGKERVQKRLKAKYLQQKELPSITLDGVQVSLNINAGLSRDLVTNNLTSDFDSVALYRTELPFMLTEDLPSIKEQIDTYRRALIQAQGKPVVFRTLDIGSDKVLPYLPKKAEENPAMGWRSIRMTLDRRALLRNQLKAFLRAAAGRELRIMFPMITTVQEFIEAKKTLNLEVERERAANHKLPKSIKVGTMLEVPALIFQLDQLLKEVDFISIGTNDLTQFIYATDRGNQTIWDRYDSLSPALLRVLKYINDKCLEAGKPCSVCGEMASHPLEAVALISLGFKSLSMNPGSLGAVKAAVRTLDKSMMASYLNRQLNSPEDSLREKLRLFAQDHHIFIE